MRTVAILQARVGSTRLPGKILEDLGGQPMLARQIERLRRCTRLSDLVIATTVEPGDDAVVTLARQIGVGVFRGSERDVLSRFVGAAKQHAADVVVRLTADCPFIDPSVVDRVVSELLEHANACDYASNVDRRTYPRGLDTEAFFMDTLLRIDRLAGSDAAAREHVTVVARSLRPELFSMRGVEDDADHSEHRWTVDTPADLAFVRNTWDALTMGARFVGYRELLAFFAAHPERAHLDTEGKTWDPNAVRRAAGVGGKRPLGTLSVRPFAEQDCKRLFDWTNDPSVRAVSFSREPIAWADHCAWFARRLGDPDTRGYIVLEDGAPVAQVRFDRQEPSRAVISVSVDSVQRGRGLGARAIAVACAELQRDWPGVDVVAYVLPDNGASLAAFAAAGFSAAEDCEQHGRPAKRQVLAARR